MAFMRITSPHAYRAFSTSQVMRLVILATLPGLAALTWFFGWGSLINVLWASLVGVGCEALILKLRRRPVAFFLKDNTALLTSVLLGLALPPLAPWWLTLVGVAFAIIVAKQLYGGMGNNPFNPAMVGYALLLISFPVEMTSWAGPQSALAAQGIDLGLLDSLKIVFGSGDIAVDAYTMATPLDAFKHKGAMTAEDFWATDTLLHPQAWTAWSTVSLAYLAGGAFLLYKRIFTWHTPVAMLLALLVLSTLFYGGDPSNYGSPLFHLLSGATLFGAFFIATDPVTAATSNRGKLVYGAGIGILVYIIRTWGNYPDAIAFSVLLMNFAAPFIDHYTQPRTYGHDKAKRGLQ